MASLRTRSLTPKLCNKNGCNNQIYGSKDICEGCRTKKLWIDMQKRSQKKQQTQKEKSTEGDRQLVAELLRRNYPNDKWTDIAVKIDEYDNFEKMNSQGLDNFGVSQDTGEKKVDKKMKKEEGNPDNYFIPIDKNNKKRFDLPTSKRRWSPFLTKGIEDGGDSDNLRSSSAPTIGDKNNDDNIFQMDMGGRKKKRKKRGGKSPKRTKKKRKKRVGKSPKTKKKRVGKSPKRRWSRKYKLSINCKKPKGFSQKQYCKGRLNIKTKRRNRKRRKKTQKRRRK